MKKRLLFVSIIAGSLLNFPAFAEDTSIKTDKNIKPAVEDKSGIKLESNGEIIPVKDLKGTIKKEEVKEEETPFKAWINGDYATGDWKGLRTKLEEKGITFEAEYINDNFLKMRGGLNNKHPLKYQGLINTSLEINTEKAGLWKGGKLFTNFVNLHGTGLTDNHIGDLQVISNIDAEPNAQLLEYWYEQSILNEKIKVKIGRQDANVDFCALENAGDYINSSFGLIPNVPIPAYPAAGLGVSTIISPHKSVDIKYGFFDGNFQIGTNAFKTAFDEQNGTVHITEIAIKPEIKGHQGKYIAGYWLHTCDTDEITDSADVRTFENNQGFYAGFDQKIFNEKNDKEQGLNMIGQFGWAPSDRNEIARYYGVGLKYIGLIPKRNKDVTGIGTAIADVSNRYKSIDGRTQESVLEIFHKIRLTNWLTIQPNMQYIFNPGGGGKNAFAMGIRSVITF
jgi:porin